MNKILPKKGLVIATTVAVIAVLISFRVLQEQKPARYTLIETKDQPTMGNIAAKVHIVLFEEPRCSGCRRFNNTIFPQFKHYIDDNKVLYTVIPLSFLEHSMPAAVASLCLYHQDLKQPNSSLFFDFFSLLYQSELQWGKPLPFQEMIQKLPGVDAPLFDTCMSQKTFRTEIEKNNRYAQKIMHGELTSPVMYINGLLVEPISAPKIIDMIEQELAK